jgi:hypothetical protein
MMMVVLSLPYLLGHGRLRRGCCLPRCPALGGGGRLRGLRLRLVLQLLGDGRGR